MPAGAGSARPQAKSCPSRRGGPRRWRGSQIDRSHSGGARQGCAGSTDSASRPRRTRIRSMTAGASMLAMTRSRPPHCRQVSMSMSKTRLRRCAQDKARCPSAGDASPRSLAAAARVSGQLLEARPDVRIHVLHHVTQVDRAIGIGKCAADEDLANGRRHKQNRVADITKVAIMPQGSACQSPPPE